MAAAPPAVAAVTAILAGLLCAALLLPGAVQGQRLMLDHVPIAVADLDAAVRDFQALGFTIKPGRVHPNSVVNAHVKFADGTALELITAGEARDAVAAGYMEYLRGGEGAAFLSLTGANAAGVATRLDASDIGYQRITGSYYEWITFDGASPFRYLFFGWLSSPPADPPELLAHANGVARLEAVWIVDDEVAAERALLEAFGVDSGGAVTLPGDIDARAYRTDRGWIYLGIGAATSDARPILGITLAVADLDRTLAVVRSAVAGRDARGRFARLAPASAHGVWIEFLERR